VGAKALTGTGTAPSKLSMEWQKQFSDRLIFEPSIFDKIDPAAKIHEQTKRHPLSSCAACLNVIGSISTDPAELKTFLASFGLEIEELYEFPCPLDFGDMVYHDKGYVIFEWIGPKDSPINERGGGRGQNRTSIDAFLLGRINGTTTQILIEWKFTEGLSRELALGRFCGGKGIERPKRYSSVLAELRKLANMPFDLPEEYKRSNPKSSVGLCDFSPDHLYQLLRMTLLAKKTTRVKLGEYVLEDYRIVHLTHSQNDQINILQAKYLAFSPGLQRYSGRELHEVWKELLAPADRGRFVYGHWDNAISALKNDSLRTYLSQRYV
jgi:hypothetical protein